MRKPLSLILAGLAALALGALGSVALASTFSGVSSSDAAREAGNTETVPGVYGAR